MIAAEMLYAGDAGDAWLDRCGEPHPRRAPFWQAVAASLRPVSVLEVGCGSGANLAHFPPHVRLIGVDINRRALALLGEQASRTQGVRASAARLPFCDRAVDLAITCGLLMHVPDAAFAAVCAELGRVAASHVLLMEYHDETDTREIPWRGSRNVLFARPFGLAFWRACPDWIPIGSGDVNDRLGFDPHGLRWHLFGRQATYEVTGQRAQTV